MAHGQSARIQERILASGASAYDVVMDDCGVTITAHCRSYTYALKLLNALIDAGFRYSDPILETL